MKTGNQNIQGRLTVGGYLTANELTTLSLNIVLVAFRSSIANSYTLLQMVDSFIDEYEDESGIDTGISINQEYNSTDDYYRPAIVAGGIDVYTKLLYHLNGTNGSTTFLDSSGNGHDVNTVNGNAQVSTTSPKFGTGSLLLDGSGDSIVTASHSDFNLSNNDFTIDFWIKKSDVNTAQQIFAFGNTGGFSAVTAYINTAKINVLASTSGSAYEISISGGISVVANTWTHIAIVRSGSSFKLFVQGVADNTATNAGALVPTNAQIYIGSNQLSTFFFAGNIDEFRLSNGIARWTSGFTPPVTEYTLDVTPNVTLISQDQPVASGHTNNQARIILFEEDIDAIAENTDFKAYVSRDNGSTYSLVTLADEGFYASGARILSGSVDISGQPAGTAMVYKITSHNNKNFKLHGTALTWK